MTTTELIKAIRNCTDQNRNCAKCQYTDLEYPNCCEALMQLSADRLEELDERLDIMREVRNDKNSCMDQNDTERNTKENTERSKNTTTTDSGMVRCGGSGCASQREDV